MKYNKIIMKQIKNEIPSEDTILVDLLSFSKFLSKCFIPFNILKEIDIINKHKMPDIKK